MLIWSKYTCLDVVLGVLGTPAGLAVLQDSNQEFVHLFVSRKSISSLTLRISVHGDAKADWYLVSLVTFFLPTFSKTMKHLMAHLQDRPPHCSAFSACLSWVSFLQGPGPRQDFLLLDGEPCSLDASFDPLGLTKLDKCPESLKISPEFFF